MYLATKGNRPYGTINQGSFHGPLLLMFIGLPLQKRVLGKRRNDTITIDRNSPVTVKILYRKKYRTSLLLVECLGLVRQWLSSFWAAPQSPWGVMTLNSGIILLSCQQVFSHLSELDVPECESCHSTEAAQQNAWDWWGGGEPDRMCSPPGCAAH